MLELPVYINVGSVRVCLQRVVKVRGAGWKGCVKCVEQMKGENPIGEAMTPQTAPRLQCARPDD